MDPQLRFRARNARAAIESGALRGRALLDLLRSIPFVDRDAWIDELLGFPVPPSDGPLPRGSVPYLPCGVEDIVAMVLDVPVTPDDVIVDLGSGLGRVVVLAHLLSGARTHGIEIQHHLVTSARARCAELRLPRISFVHGNAAELELDGSIFFLYAPFNGAMLTRVLGRLEAVAQRHSIVVAAVGLEFHDVAWLRPRRTSSVSLMLYDSQPPTAPR